MKVDCVVISKETFEQMESDDKLNVLFDCIVSSSCKMDEINIKLDKKKKVDAATAGIFGFMGGLFAHLGQLTFFKH